MTYEEKKKALESYGRLKIRCGDLEENIARLRSERGRITPRLCDTPGGGGFTNRLQALTERLFELEETLGQKRIEAIEAVCEAFDISDLEIEQRIKSKIDRYMGESITLEKSSKTKSAEK